VAQQPQRQLGRNLGGMVARREGTVIESVKDFANDVVAFMCHGN